MEKDIKLKDDITVEELIEELKKLPKDYVVNVTATYDGWYEAGDVPDNIKVVDEKKKVYIQNTYERW